MENNNSFKKEKVLRVAKVEVLLSMINSLIDDYLYLIEKEKENFKISQSNKNGKAKSFKN